MKKKIFQIISLLLILAVTLCTVSFSASGAMSKSQLQDEINKLEQQSKAKEAEIKKLKAEANQQKAVKAAIEEKIALTQQQIALCNNEIAKINGMIAENKAEIEKINQEIEADKLAFKKRLRAIYMSNSGSNIQILMGADSFSKYLQLSQLSEASAARDKLIINNLLEAAERVKKKQEENEKLLEEQVSIKATIAQKQKELQSQNNEIQSVINSINQDASQLDKENADIEKQIKQYQKTLASLASTGGTSYVYKGDQFLWPVSGYYSISAGFASNDSVHKGRHNGIDIAGAGIQDKPILAIADGIVAQSNNSCTHNYKKSGSCGCGGGFGNYVSINHGTGSDGKTYVATYGHMSRTAVSTGTVVKKGQVIGYVGTTGWSTGYHLHLGISVNGSWVNPLNFYTKTK